MDFALQETVLKQVAHCVRPLMWTHDDEDYPYSIGATCFFVRVGSAIFLVTTRHGTESREACDLFITPSDASTTAVPFESVHRAHEESIDEFDSDKADFLFVRVRVEEMEPSELALLRPFPDAQSLSPELLFRPGNTYVFCGFPAETSSVDYAEAKIRRRMRGGSAEYDRPFGPDFCHTLRFGGIDDVEDTNHFSGSPVFLTQPDANGGVGVALAGMVLRSTKQSGVMHVLDWHYLYTQLAEAATFKSE